MNDQQLLRYSRHILLDQIGIEGQQKLLDSHALIIGAGGLGSPAALYLAGAGVGQLTLADHDSVDLTNLQRQIMHGSSRIGISKVASARQALSELNPDIVLHTLEQKLAGQALSELISRVDVVLDCSDNFATRQAVNQACVQFGKPLVAGAAIGFDGQISVYDLRHADAPCYACVFPPDLPFEEAMCSTMGVFSPLVGIIGSMQAAEALKVLLQIGRSLQGRLLMLSGLEMEWNSIGLARNAACPVCGSRHQPL